VWLAQAAHDLNASECSLKNNFNEWACFQAQQASEKALKSVLVFHGKSAPKVHKLGVIMGLIKNVDSRFKGTYLDIADLQSYTFTSRYPFLIPGNNETPHEYITSSDAKLCIKKAKRILSLVQRMLNA
jgi:HEPN domain-containing protein